MYASSVAADIRVFSFGYSASLDRKKQYVQSMLHVAPVGFASRWKPGGPPSGIVGGAGVGVGVSVSAIAVIERVTRDSAGPREVMLARATSAGPPPRAVD